MKKTVFIFSLFTLLYFGIPVLLVFADDYTSVNHPPEPMNISVTTEKNTAISFDLAATDKDGDELTYTIQAPTENATATLSEKTVSLDPATGFIGSIEFAYSVSDGFTEVDAKISVEVTDSSVVQPCEEDNSGHLDVAAGIGAPGGLVSIPVRINNAPNDVSAFGFELVYNPEMLSFKSFKKGALAENLDFFNVQLVKDGMLRCGGVKNKGIQNGASGSILFVQFEIIQTEPATKLSLQGLADDMANWSTSHGCFQGGCNGDINADGEITPMDALNTFEKYLSICPTSSDLDCDTICGDVNNDGETTPADTLCIFQYYLGMPNCLDDTTYAPEAEASASPKKGQAPLTVWFTAAYDESSDGNRLKYEWDFQNDGTFDDDGPEVQFTYFKEGTYTAILKVTDQDGLTDMDEIVIVVEPGNHEENVITILASPPEGEAPLRVHFFADDHLDPVYPIDASITNFVDEMGNTIDHIVNQFVDGEKSTEDNGQKWFWDPPTHTKFEWDFNDDGKVDARGKEASWLFKEEGEYLIRVKGIYDDGSTAIGETLVHVYEPEPYVPEKIYIVARPAIGLAPLKTKMYVFGYYAKEFLANAKIQWDLNDDGQFDAEGIEVFHTFEEAGEYIVSVIVTNADGTELKAETEILVKTDNTEPADMTIIASPDKGPAPLNVEFKLTNNQLKHLITHECRIQWDFESDGIIDAKGAFVKHVYKTEGEFVASCQITDLRGKIYKTETIISVGGENTILPEIPEQIGRMNEALEPIKIGIDDNSEAFKLIGNSSNNELIKEINIEQINGAWIVSIVPAVDEYGFAIVTLSAVDSSGKEIAKTRFEVTILAENEFNDDKDDEFDGNMDDEFDGDIDDEFDGDMDDEFDGDMDDEFNDEKL
jgi:PKD repeat protein